MDDIPHMRPGVEAGTLREAMRTARVEVAEQSSAVADLRDADRARLELLQERLDRVFAQVPADVDLFDRALTEAGHPRLWIDAVTHVEMGRDRRTYRLLQDTQSRRVTLAENASLDAMAEAVTRYVARRLVARERLLVEPLAPTPIEPSLPKASQPVAKLSEPPFATEPAPAVAEPRALPQPARAQALPSQAPMPGAATNSGGRALAAFMFGLVVGAMAMLATVFVIAGR